jgi:AraC family ethanolamine operon transcriptional activator
MNPAPIAADRPQRWTLTTRDVDAYAHGQSGWRLECDLLPGGTNPFTGFLDHVQLPGLRLVREYANRALRQQGEMSPACCGFALAQRQEGEARFSGQRLGASSVMVGRTDELDLCSPAGFELMGIVADNGLLCALGEAPPWLERRLVLHIDAPALQGLRRVLHDAFLVIDASSTWLDDPVATRQLRDEVLLAWLEALPDTVDLRALRSSEARRRVVHRACDFIMERLDEPLSMLEVCRRIGASQRKLTYCFQEALGLSPARYLRALRLNGARRELKRPHRGVTSVQDVAAHWGFWHPSQFVVDYKRQFGELPSQTLRAAWHAGA